MAKEIMHRNAADNVYLHKDFHGALSCGIAYLEDNFGAAAVRRYLQSFARQYYAPLSERIRREGLQPLHDHLLKVYTQEGGKVQLRFSDDELIAEAAESPAVMHMRKNEYPIARSYHETIRTIHETLVENTPFAYALDWYEPLTGGCHQRFYRQAETGVIS